MLLIWRKAWRENNSYEDERTNYCRFQVYEDSPRDVLAGAGLTEEGVEGVITASDGLVTGHLPIGLDAVLQAVQLPAGVAHLHAGLADV